MSTTADRDLNKLHPDFKKKVDLFLADNPEVFVTEAWRSPERQAELYQSGASKVSHSNHQDGRAIDIAFHGSELYPENHNIWLKVADSAKKYGIDWGYILWEDMGFIDKPHFQDNFKPLITMGYYESIYWKENPEGTAKVYSNPKKALDTFGDREQIAFLMIGMERIAKGNLK